jgi:hypothetical protein
MVGEDSESGYQDETSEGASSADELEGSDFESYNGSHHVSRRGPESEEYSTNGESSGEESADDSGKDENGEDKTLQAPDMLSRNEANSSTGHPRSRLPRLQQLYRQE